MTLPLFRYYATGGKPPETESKRTGPSFGSTMALAQHRARAKEGSQ